MVVGGMNLIEFVVKHIVIVNIIHLKIAQKKIANLIIVIYVNQNANH